MRPVKISTCMSPNMDFICVDLAEYLSNKLEMEVEAVVDIPWQERENLLDKGEIDLCWICGLPYVWKADRENPNIDLLAAPVFQGDRYQNQAVYFSDIVVKYNSPIKKFDELLGATWAINEPNSHSGSNVVRYELARMGKKAGFFGKVIVSGSHISSLDMILKGEVDGSAIDSTVLEQEIFNNPKLSSKIRIIRSLGPSPVPPWLVSQKTSSELTSAIRQIVMHMEQDKLGKNLLQNAGIKLFKDISDDAYNPIREMDDLAKNIEL